MMLPGSFALTTHYSFRFLLAALAAWRLTHLISQEDGPWDLLRRFRGSLGSGLAWKLVTCFYCLSIWVSLPFALFVGGSLVEMLVEWLAISGAAILLERATREPFEFKFEDDEHGLLRTENRRTLDDHSERP